MKRATLSTHVLDVSLGKPAAGVAVSLDGGPAQVTDADGRVPELAGAGIGPGTYQLVFDLHKYFGRRPHLFKRVTLDLTIDELRHYHVPLLIAPYSCGSYRGT
jgi:5-hydroxyisourate hydrolase